MDTNEKLEIIKKHHKLKTLALYKDLDREARRILMKLIESNQINYFSYNCSRDELAKILLAVIIQKLADTTAIRAGSRDYKRQFDRLLSFLYREGK